jgi:DNA-binding NarL/FixJ family response regulator
VIRVLVVDDHELVRIGICRLLEEEDDIEVVGQVGGGHDAVRVFREKAPDVVLLDYNLPDIDGLETTRRLLGEDAGARVLILTMYSNEEYASRLIRAGAAGYVVKAAPAEELLKAIRKVAAGGIYVDSSIMERMVGRLGQPSGDAPESRLSSRERQVLVRLARGMTTREVASSLSLSVSTVETYRSRMLEKLGLRNNSDITRFAIRAGLVDVG